MRLCFEMRIHLEIKAERERFVLPVFLQIAVVEAAAVAAAVTLRVKGKTRHQHECLFIIGNGAVLDRFGDVVGAGRDRIEVIKPQEAHLLAEDLRHGNAFAVALSLLHDRACAYLLIVGKVGIERFCFAVERVLCHHCAECCAGLFDLRLGKGAFLFADLRAERFFVHNDLHGVVFSIVAQHRRSVNCRFSRAYSQKIHSISTFLRYNTSKKLYNPEACFMQKSVLIIEDDYNIADLLRLYLEKEGFSVSIASDGARGVEMFREQNPTLVLLDLMLPVLDGWGVCRAIRQESDVPIIMLTAKGETDDKVTGLKLGADDYITKPFEMKEVLARIEAVLRRSGEELIKGGKRLEFDNLIIDMDAFELTVAGKKVDTPPKEMELLFHLASTPNRVYTRNQLLDEVWGFDYFGDSRTVDVHVKRLREKLEGVSEAWGLKTVWGVGYKFEVL